MNRKFTAILTAVCMMIGCMAGSAPAQAAVFPGVSGEWYAVYEYYSPFMRDYLYTSSETEKKALDQMYLELTETYEYRGIVGYVQNSSNSSNIPVYRFWNEETGDHFYTASEAEKSALAVNLKNDTDHYVYEGIAFYAPIDWGMPVYRFFDEKNYNHYYTSYDYMKDQLIDAYNNGTGFYRYEGIAWNWLE